MTFEEVWNSGTHISQSIFREEGEQLYKEVMKLPEGSVIVEIGAYVGRSTHVLCTTANLRNSIVITIDPFLTAFDGWHNSDPKTAFTENVLTKFNNLTLIEGYSQDVSEQILYCDFIFIDGDHSYEGVLSDIELYLPKLKPGGCVAFHDYVGSSFHGLQQAVNEKVGHWHTVSTAYSLLVKQKPFENEN
jgi:predicted O-methyltransferase YrrM